MFVCPADLRTAFGLLDRNRDGRVTAGELQFMLQNLGIQVRDELINDLINEASHSGKVRPSDRT
jgi:calmodulin